MKKILVVCLGTHFHQLLAYFPCGPTADTRDTSCFLVGAEWKQHGLKPRPSEAFKGILSWGPQGGMCRDHRRWSCNELVKLPAVPLTGDYSKESHIKYIFISHFSPREPLRSCLSDYQTCCGGLCLPRTSISVGAWFLWWIISCFQHSSYSTECSQTRSLIWPNGDVLAYRSGVLRSTTRLFFYGGKRMNT